MNFCWRTRLIVVDFDLYLFTLLKDAKRTDDLKTEEEKREKEVVSFSLNSSFIWLARADLDILIFYTLSYVWSLLSDYSFTKRYIVLVIYTEYSPYS